MNNNHQLTRILLSLKMDLKFEILSKVNGNTLIWSDLILLPQQSNVLGQFIDFLRYAVLYGFSYLKFLRSLFIKLTNNNNNNVP